MFCQLRQYSQLSVRKIITGNKNKVVKHALVRFYACDQQATPKVAIIGSGPAGFYTAQQILKEHNSVEVDIYEKLPVPFGLVRYGVAPDHPEVKNVIHTFTQTARNSRCRFLGNVQVGHDISLKQLQAAYTAVVLAYGADDDKRLDLPGENLPGVLSARAFVGWYNGLPEHANLKVSLNHTDTAIIFGQGNVAIDVARILLTPVEILQKTDITEYALESLKTSTINRVILCGRRGPLQTAFSTAELREMTKLPKCQPVLQKQDFEHLKDKLSGVPRPRKRLTELLIKTAFGPNTEEETIRWEEANKTWELLFLRSPTQFLANKEGNLARVKLVVNTMKEGENGIVTAAPTEVEEELACGLAFRSIGYKCLSLEENLPFDEKSAVVPNIKGRVLNAPGLYCSGWVKRGPVGVIASTMTDSFETGKAVIQDLKEGILPIGSERRSEDGIHSILQEKGIKVITFSDWDKIDKIEMEAGEKMNKPREKIASIDKLLAASL